MKLSWGVLAVLSWAIVLGGCMHPVEIHFVDAATRQPLADLPMTKARVTTALFMQAIETEGLQADQQGVVTVNDLGDEDELIVEHDERYALIRREGRQLWISQGQEKDGGKTAARIGPEAGPTTGVPRYTVPLTNSGGSPGKPQMGQVVRAW